MRPHPTSATFKSDLAKRFSSILYAFYRSFQLARPVSKSVFVPKPFDERRKDLAHFGHDRFDRGSKRRAFGHLAAQKLPSQRGFLGQSLRGEEVGMGHPVV